MVIRLHFCLLCSLVILMISLFICCRVGEVESLYLRSSFPISVGTVSVLSRRRTEGICGVMLL